MASLRGPVLLERIEEHVLLPLRRQQSLARLGRPAHRGAADTLFARAPLEGGVDVVGDLVDGGARRTSQLIEPLA